MSKDKCSSCKEVKTVVYASCREKGHGTCSSCLHELVKEMARTPTPQHCLQCQGSSNCSGRFSLRTIHRVLKHYSDGSALFTILEEAEARFAFLMQTKPQEVVL